MNTHIEISGPVRRVALEMARLALVRILKSGAMTSEGSPEELALAALQGEEELWPQFVQPADEMIRDARADSDAKIEDLIDFIKSQRDAPSRGPQDA